MLYQPEIHQLYHQQQLQAQTQQMQKPIHPYAQLEPFRQQQQQPSAAGQQVAPQSAPQQAAMVSPIKNPNGQQPQQNRPLPRTSSGMTAPSGGGGGKDAADGDEEILFEIPNNRSAQFKQIHASKDMGMKCSQI